ncbi:hypothetical protein BCR36DRAFT_294823 [Piromyces finnis]|uniref:Uncharacterized protein n=1 Tax=Piromyces finnis TaxID=1754191 RepID=A0A1Y1V6I3_9FUNG|nr:hypothetical protein BCR36DRAFT_294823 [Piromyces finnis]|eukprot:ORX47932.1 hypothetical protein BCR36DRAFT_294823 [Piromyces finnis]
MSIKNIFIYNRIYLLYPFLAYLILKVSTIDVKIENDNNSIKNLPETVNQLMQTSYDEVKLIFNDNHYAIAKSSSNKFNIKKTLIFYSDNGTVFDYQYHSSTSFNFNFQSMKNDIRIIFQNITFYNFYDDGNVNNNFMFFDLPFEHNNYQIEFNNCIFKKVHGLISKYYYASSKSVQSSPQAKYINCKFM